MKRAWGLRALRWSVVTFGIVLLTSVTIDATTQLGDSQSALAILTDRALTPDCAPGSVRVAVDDENWCVDIFPATAGPTCPHQTIRSPRDTTDNIAAGCAPVVAAGRIPWLHVAQHHATQICALMNKQLLPPAVWYHAAVGTPDNESCHTTGSAARANAETACVSGAGAYDMVGNVWEWVDAEIVDGVTAASTSVPATGYVQAVNRVGWPTETSSTTNDLFNADYFWSEPTGTRGVLRGGFYRALGDAGVYAVHTGVAPTFASNATGVRCGYRLP